MLINTKSTIKATVRSFALLIVCLSLTACEGRANIAKDTSPEDIEMRLNLKYTPSYNQQEISGWLYIDNYHDRNNQFFTHNEIEQCGFFHRQQGRAESYDRRYTTDFDGYMTLLRCDDISYNEGTYLIITPFIEDENRNIYTGKPIEFQLR